ncbi:MAG: beta-ketoacyl synthase N-terminal-like domain-containing protein, partial [Chitinophagaceae bacterium]
DPVQRLLMEVTYETIENAGYNPDFFDNSRTVIYLSHADYSYYTFLLDKVQHEPTIFTGNNHFAASGRIARYFNLRGNATVVNNGCSSALNAVHLACNELIFGEADYAIAMGARITIMVAEKNPAIFDIGIEAFDGKTRSFSDDSMGSGEGEMIGCILLKPLEKAMADNDHIYAVIKSTVANQSGMLASSLTATNGAAQAEMLREAWKKANIDPMTITQLEAHGSGTKLGDPIEIAGVDLAYEGITDKKQFIAVSSVKTNIGHTDTGAGMAGLIKAALSVKHKELFPSLHFNKPNPFIDFKNSVTYINTELKKWQPECSILRVGVNSLGFTGNNVHVLLENPAERTIEKNSYNKAYLFTLSAKTFDALKRNIRAFIDYLSEPNEDLLRDICFTLSVGRKHYDHRYAAVAKDKEGLLDLLKKKCEKTADEEEKKPLKKTIFVFSDNCNADEDITRYLSETYPLFKDEHQKCLSLQAEKNENTDRFSFQYAMYQLLTASGLSSKQLVGLGVGKQVIAAITGKSTFEEAIKTASSLPPEEHIDLPGRLRSLVERETEKENVLFIEMGPEASISQNLKKLHSSYQDIYEVLCMTTGSEDPLIWLLKECYLFNYKDIDWNKYAETNKGYRIVLPTYQFEKTRCWITGPFSISETRQKANNIQAVVEKSVAEEKPFPKIILPDEWSETEKKVAHIWSSVLRIKDLKLTDDFFALGGHSLFLIKVNNRIEKEFDFKFQLKEMFAFATIRSLAQAIDMIAGEGRAPLKRTEIIPIENQEYYPLSFSQKRLWILSQFVESSLAYNLADAYIFKGKLNKRSLKKAFDTLIERHE